MLDVARRRPTPPSLLDPPPWLAELAGFGLFEVQRTDTGWSAFPEGADEDVEFPGGTWRVTLVMPVDLSIADGVVDPLRPPGHARGRRGEGRRQDRRARRARTRSGKSWTEIGQALGITKQSAWEKYSGED